MADPPGRRLRGRDGIKPGPDDLIVSLKPHNTLTVSFRTQWGQ